MNGALIGFNRERGAEGSARDGPAGAPSGMTPRAAGRQEAPGTEETASRALHRSGAGPGAGPAPGSVTLSVVEAVFTAGRGQLCGCRAHSVEHTLEPRVERTH